MLIFLFNVLGIYKAKKRRTKRSTMMDLVKFNGDKAVTDSTTVARVFGKSHRNVNPRH